MPESLVAQITLPSIPVGEWFEAIVQWLFDHLLVLFNAISDFADFVYEGLSQGLLLLPALAMVVVLGALGWWLRGWKFAIYGLLAMAFIVSMGYWKEAMESLTLVVIATAVAVVLAIPLGILAAYNNGVSRAIRPLLDFMQTLPPFVYLIPAVVLFGIGVTPGMVATVVFAMPPGVRLTELGIRQVDEELVEAGNAFGARPWQILTRIQVPLAMPTVLAGINQVIMLALSMVVISGMVGAPGLGGEVYAGITRADSALGFSSGLAVVLLAIYLDRLTQGLGNRSAVRRAERSAAR